ncbi:hypothetical protein IEO21_09878 [Rhodonia placenta]|uniref:Uncharacterized protein n=1 Tax=Rhodonia placenta TaxID=104341 RepID=A0A8H7NTN5_9APHY|nr:hypothetical protein IEO21_09878 [Postia placenta]
MQSRPPMSRPLMTINS